MTEALRIADAVTPPRAADEAIPRGSPRTAASFAEMLGSMLDGATRAVAVADGAAGALAAGRGNIADAAVARAKADTVLEVLAVAAARVGGAVSTLMQTQI